MVRLWLRLDWTWKLSIVLAGLGAAAGTWAVIVSLWVL